MKEIDKLFNQTELAFRYYQLVHQERNYDREAARTQFRQDSNIDSQIIKQIVEEASRPFCTIKKHFVLNRRPTGESIKQHIDLNPFSSIGQGYKIVIKAGLEGRGTIDVGEPDIMKTADSPALENLTIDIRSLEEYVILQYTLREDSSVEGYYMVNLNSEKRRVEVVNKFFIPAEFYWFKQEFFSREVPLSIEVEQFIRDIRHILKYMQLAVYVKPLASEQEIKYNENERLLYRAVVHPNVQEIGIRLGHVKNNPPVLEAKLNIIRENKPQIKGIYTVNFFNLKRGSKIRNLFLECFNGVDC